MKKESSKFHFPLEIKLESNPLLEAWLEIRWQLESGVVSGFMRDAGFPFALGTFYVSVRDQFKYREDLEASHAPQEMFPYVVRHRFRPGEDEWPLLQLGPGVGTVNFTSPYTWGDFKETALYLREKLLAAYSETELKMQMVALRYRNGVQFEYLSSNILDFLKHNLNTSVTLPIHIPGSGSSVTWPTSMNIVLSFDLLEPGGTGTLRFATGIKRQKHPETGQETENEMLIWQLEVESRDDDAPKLSKEDEFTQWLTSAHNVIHEWFFSLIEGPLYSMYKGG